MSRDEQIETSTGERGVGDDLQLGEDGRIDQDLSCLKCGYNLRGLLPDRLCPECATAVGQSAHGNLLRYCHPSWTRKLASGMNWITVGIGLVILLPCCMILPFVLLLRIYTFLFALAAAPLVLLVGFWKVTAPDPSQVGHEEEITSRRLVRAAMPTTFILLPPAIVVGGYSSTAGAVVQAVAFLVVSVGVVGLFQYARRLAMRIPDLQLAESARTAMIATAVALVGAGLTGMLVMANPSAVAALPGGNAGVSSDSGIVGKISRHLEILVSLGGLILGIWFLRLVDRFRKALREAARQAEATWARGSNDVDMGLGAQLRRV